MMEMKISKFIKEASDKIHQLYNFECGLDLISNSESSTCPTDIFNSKYKIRALLSGLANSIKRIDPSLSHIKSTLLWGFFILKIATNCIETEEPAEGRSQLHELLTVLRNKPDLEALLGAINDGDKTDTHLDIEIVIAFAGLLQFCFNSLAVISAPTSTSPEDGRMEKKDRSALNWLLKAQTVYQIHKRICISSSSNAPECWESLGFIQPEGAGEDTTRLIKEIMFETGYTTTVFMLAQAYSNDGDKMKAAEYCCKTLQRQLHFAPIVDNLLDGLGVFNQSRSDVKDMDDVVVVQPADWMVTAVSRLDPLDWAANASTLSQFYMSDGCYTSALECLMSASTMLEKHEVPSEENVNSLLKYQRIQADLARNKSEFALALLDEGRKAILNKASLEDNKLQEAYGSLFKIDTTDCLLEKIRFEAETCVEDVVKMLSTPPINYQSASCLFRWINRSLTTAGEFYSLNEHCLDAADLIRCRARAYDYLTSYESEISRKCCMQKRRADMLEALLNKLNPQHYMSCCRALMFEIADALTMLREFTEDKIKTIERPVEEKSRLMKKTNLVSRRAIKMYSRFVDSFRKPTDKTTPDFYEPSSLRSILLAYFYTARLHSKMTAVDRRSRLEELSAALDNYRCMIVCADKHSSAGKLIGPQFAEWEEVSIARDMLQLLPVQMEKIAADVA